VVETAKAKYERMAREIARQHGIDENIFVSLVNTESSFNPDAKDYKTGTHYGLTQVGSAAVADVNGDMSRVFDPYYNLTYGAKYLAQMKDKFGDYYNALRGYNQGANTAVMNRRAGSDYANKILNGASTDDAASPKIENAATTGVVEDLLDFGKRFAPKALGGTGGGLLSFLGINVEGWVIREVLIPLFILTAIILLFAFGLQAMVSGEMDPRKAISAASKMRAAIA